MDDFVYTLEEIAELLKISNDKTIRLFEDEPGVIDLGTSETTHKRRYRILRIPRAVLNRVLDKMKKK